MISERELRIGNIVNFVRSGTAEHAEVLAVSKKNIKLRTRHSTVSVTSNAGVNGLDVEAIEVVPETLREMGFIMIPDRSPYKDERAFVLNVFPATKLIWCSGQLFKECEYGVFVFLTTGGIRKNVHALHDLQNAIYALTGEEISPIKEPAVA